MRALLSPLLAVCVSVAAAGAAPATAWAHGGQFYKPPPREGRVKEPDPGPGGGGPGDATTGSGRGDPPVPAVTDRTDARLGPDDWDAWWTTQRTAFVPKRPAGAETPGEATSKGPTERDAVLAALRRAVDDPEEDVSTSALVALGRIGDAPSEAKFRTVLLDASRAPSVRESAAVALAFLGPRGGDDSSRQTLERVALATENPARLRAVCMYSLGLRAEPDSVETAAGVALSPRTDPQVAAASASALGLVGGPEASSLLLQLLQGGRMAVDTKLLRVHAAHGLALRGDAAALTALMRATNEPDPALRRAAALAIAALAPQGDDVAQRALRTMLDRDDDVSCRDAAVLALGRQGHAASRKLIEDAVVGGRAVHRTYAVSALGLWARRNGDPSAAAPVRAFLAPATDPRLRGAACFALSLARDREAATLVLRVAEAKNDTTLRAVALSAVPAIADRESAAPVLRRLLAADEPPEVRREAAAALGILGDPEAAPLLEKLLSDEERLFVRAAAIVALGRIGGPRALPNLRTILETPDGPAMLRALAAVGLGILRESPHPRPLHVVADDLDWGSMTDAAAELISIL